jgi:hypothetical protein
LALLLLPPSMKRRTATLTEWPIPTRSMQYMPVIASITYPESTRGHAVARRVRMGHHRASEAGSGGLARTATSNRRAGRRSRRSISRASCGVGVMPVFQPERCTECFQRCATCSTYLRRERD